MNISEIRNLFPYLKTGRIYFNHSSTAPLSERVLEAINKHLILQSEGKIDDYISLLKIVEETRILLGRLINSPADRIAFYDNTSTGLNMLAKSIKWKTGDRIILNDLEFPSNVYPFLNLVKDGIEIDFVKSKDGKVSADDIIEMIKPATKLISISSVQFLTGYRVDLEKIGTVCREKGIIFSVDAIQGLGAVRLDVEKDKIDFISSGTQKWLLGLQGFSFIYISKELQEKLEPVFAGWMGVENAWSLLDYNLKLRQTADALQTGTINTLGVKALNASLKLFEEFGHANIEERILNNSEYLINELQKISITTFPAESERKNLSGIVSFKSENAQKILEKLTEKNIHVSVREGMLRIAPHFYNTADDIDIFIENLKMMSTD